MGAKEQHEQLIKVMRDWQEVENQTLEHTSMIMQRTDNPVVHLLMEVIQRDSASHWTVQQFIVDSLATEAVSLTAEELAPLWDAIESHVEAEKKTRDLVVAARQALAGTDSVVQEFLLRYLEIDEDKHDRLLDDLALIKEGSFKPA